MISCGSKNRFKISFAYAIVTLASNTCQGGIFFVPTVTTAFFVGFYRKYLYVTLLNNIRYVFHAAVT